MKAKLRKVGAALVPGFIKRSGQVNRYILRHSTIVFLVFTLSLTCIVWLSQSLRFVDMIVNRGLSLGVFLKFAGLLIPNLLQLILPIALFFATLFTYNRLLLDQEITILRSCGQSPRQMAKPVMTLVLFVVIFNYILGIWLMPASYRNFKDLQFDIRNNYASTLLQEGVFTDVADKITVYIRERKRDGDLGGILLYDSREPGKEVTIIADHGRLIKTPQGPNVVVEQGNRQELNKKTGKLNTLYFDEYTVDLTTYNETTGARWREPRERYPWELLNPNMNDPSDRENAQELKAELHDRILTPLKGILFTQIALIVILFGDIPRRTSANRIFLGTGLVIVGQAIVMSVTNLAGKQPYGVLLLYLTILGPLLLTTKLIYSETNLVFLNYFQTVVNRFLGRILPSEKGL